MPFDFGMLEASEETAIKDPFSMNEIPENRDLKPRLTKNALTVLEKRYLRKDENGDIIESPEDLFRRVARTIADLAGQAEVARAHMAEALSFRRLAPTN